MELIVWLVVMAVAFAAIVLGVWLAARAIGRRGRRPGPEPVGARLGAPALRMRLQELRDRGFRIDDDGREKIILWLPLLEASSFGGRVSEEYRIVVRLDEDSATARLSERRISREVGVSGAGLLRWARWRGPTEGARDRTESQGVRAIPAPGGRFGLDAAQARQVVERTIAAAGWRLG